MLAGTVETTDPGLQICDQDTVKTKTDSDIERMASSIPLIMPGEKLVELDVLLQSAPAKVPSEVTTGPANSAASCEW